MSQSPKLDSDFPSLYDLPISPIKKENLKKIKKQELRQKLRADLPVLSAREIRRHRLPYHEALLADLEESGYENTVEFIKQLLDHQDKLRQRDGPGSVIWLRPQLVNSAENLEILAKSLTAAEKAHKANKTAVEWDELLQVSTHYAFGPEDWWWLGEQLLFQTVSMDYADLYQKQKAIAYFIIGKYLVENGKNVDSGKYYLDLARDLSKGKSWNCKKFLNGVDDSISMLSCGLLYKALIEEATSLMKTDPGKAIEICLVARKRASEACDHESEFQALLLRAKCELALNRSTDAIATTTKALNRSIKRKSVSGICEAIIPLALAYLQHGKPFKCMKCLKDLKALAVKNNLPYYEGQAYRYMGAYYLHMQQPYEATPLLQLAFYRFHESNNLQRREKVRTWAAISAGEELFQAYIKLLENVDSTEEGYANLIKLIKWIDDREFFWTQESKFTFSYTSIHESGKLEMGEAETTKNPQKPNH